MSKVKSFITYLAILILIINYLFYHTISSYTFKNILRVVAFALLIFSVALNKKIKVSKVALLTLTYLIIGVLLNSEMMINILFLIIIIYSISYNCNYKNIKNIFLIISIFTILLYFGMLHFGIISNTVTNFGGRIRNTLGFDNVNAQSIYIASFFYLLLNKIEKHNFLWNIILIIPIFAITRLTNSRTLLYSSIIYLILNIISGVPLFCRLYTKLIKNKFIVFLIVALFFASPYLILLLTKFNPSIDMILSNRGVLINNYINNQSILNFIIGCSSIETVDNSYIILLFSIGIFGYLYVFHLIYKFILNQSNIKDHSYIIALLFYGTMEGILLRPECLITIYFWILIFKSNNILNFNNGEQNDKENNTY